MSDPQPNRPDCIRPRDGGEEHGRSSASARAEPESRDPSGASTAASSAPGPAAAAALSDVHPPTEQMSLRPPPTPLLDSALDVLATVELQLCLQFLDTKSKLVAARCSRRLMHAPFAWRGPCVPVSSSSQPRLGSLIRQSLLRHAPIALQLLSNYPAAEVAAIPHLHNLMICYDRPVAPILQILALPSLQRLHTLRAYNPLPLSALQLLPTLPALHKLVFFLPDESAEWSWLPAMPALTDLSLSGLGSLPQSALDAIGQCTRLQSLRLCFPSFGDGSFARLCSTSAMRRLRHLTLGSLRIQGEISTGEEYRAAFSALAQLESLYLDEVVPIDVLLLHVGRASALRTLTIQCTSPRPDGNRTQIPSRELLGQLLNAAPLLEVRLVTAASIERWRDSVWYSRTWVTASEREQMDERWRDLQRAAAELDRVVIVEGDA